MAGSLAGAAVKAGIGLGSAFLGGSVAGGSSSGSKAKVADLTAGGLKSSFANNRLTVGSTDQRRGLVNNLSNLFLAQGREFEGLRPLVKPGFGALTDARVSTLENRGASRLSNLRDNLARRRVSGSSFGQSLVQSEQRQLDQDIAETRARSFLEELDLTTSLIEKQYTSDLASVEAQLSNLNMEAQVGQALLGTAQSVLSNNAAIQSQLAVQNAQGIGAFIEPFVSSFSDSAGDAVSGLFS